MTPQRVWEEQAWLARVRRDGPQGWICGAAFLVDDQHLVTCAHVVVEAGASEPGQRVYVDMPMLDDAGCWAEALEDGWAPEDGTRGDTAVLRLERPLSGALPVPVRAAAALRGQQFQAYGFPQDYEDGVETTGRVGSRVGREWLQLEGDSGLTVEPGFSGSAVWSSDLGAVIGLVVTRDKKTQGRVAFAVPLPVLATRSAIVTGALPTALDLDRARDTHWLSRARGGTGVAGSDRWLFQGRRQALTDLVEWLTSDDLPAQRVVTGTPGSGKSAVLARLVVAADRRQRLLVPDLDLTAAWVPPPDAVAVTFHARGQTVKDLVTHVANVLGLSGVDGPEQLQHALGTRPGLRLVVDAVDEAAQPQELARLLTDLTRDGTRVLVGSRDHLLDDLDDPAPMRVDSSPYLQQQDVYDYVTALLGQPGTVREEAGADHDVAGEIVTAAEGNFLVAQLVAQSIQLGGGLTRPFPRRVHQAFERLLDALPDPVLARDLLLPLVWSEGDGLPAGPVWLTAAAAVRRPYAQADLDDLLAGPAASFLTTATKSADGRRYRLFHQALTEALTRNRDAVADARSLWSGWQDGLLSSGWSNAPQYLKTHGAEHAADADQLLPLLDDTDFLSVADYSRLLPLLPTAAGGEDAPIVRLLRQVGLRAAGLPGDRRIGLLAATAAHHQLHDLRRRFTAASSRPFRIRWAHTLGVPHRELAGHTEAVLAVALGRSGGRDIIVSGSADETVRIWDAIDGRTLGQMNHPGLCAVALGRVGGRDVIVSGGDETVRTWDANDGQRLGELNLGELNRADEDFRAMALGRIGDRDVIVCGSLESLRVWDVDVGQALSQPLTGHSGWVEAVALGRAGDRDIIVSGARDNAVRLWDAAEGRPLRSLIGHQGSVTAVALGRIDGRDVVVSGGVDGTVLLWDAISGDRPNLAVTGHAGVIASVSSGRIGDQDVLVSGGEDETVRTWDANNGQPLGAPLTGHTGKVNAVALGRIDVRDVVVSGGEDTTVRIWHPTDSLPLSRSMIGHSSWVTAVALGRIGDREVIVSSSMDKTVRTWEATTGQAIGQPLAGHDGAVTAVALGRAGGREIIVSGSVHGTLRTWDASTGLPLPEAPIAHTDEVRAIALGRAGDRDVVVSGGWDNRIRVWDATNGQPLRGPSIGHNPSIEALALGRIGDRDVIVSGSNATVRIWEAIDGHPVGQPLTGHTGYVTCLALGRAGEWEVIVSGSTDRTVRIWDALDGRPLGGPLLGHNRSVNSVALGRAGERDIIVSGGWDRTLLVWDLHTRQRLQALDVLGEPLAVALSRQTLAVAVGSAVCTLNLTSAT